MAGALWEDSAAMKDSSTNVTLPKRFWSKVDKGGPVPACRPDLGQCWIWTAALTLGTRGGYGRFFFEGKSRRSHKLAWEEEMGPVPDGLQLDHLCRVRRCCRPSHLEPVTSLENFKRGDAPAIISMMCKARRGTRRVTHCPRGHDYAEHGMLQRRAGNREPNRTCRICLKAARVSAKTSLDIIETGTVSR